jgi:putative exosortase-associated protein (TIGR04073 family)
MRKTLSLLAFVVVAGLMATGCSGPEKKFSRGVGNVNEIVRWGEFRREVEQTALNHGAQQAYTSGVVKGVGKTLSRTGVGIYEVVTFPLPTYGPIAMPYLTPEPGFPDNYKPEVMEDSMFSTDTNLGFAGGNVFPIFGWSRFRIFDTH